MLKKAKCILYLVVIVVLARGATGEAQEGYSIEISTAQKRIDYGSPIVVTLRLVYQQPRMWRVTGKIRQIVTLDRLDLQVQQSESEETHLFHLGKTVLNLQGTKGLEYTGKVVLWCHVHEERGKLIKSMIFDKPGAYTFSVMDAKKRSSNTLDILIVPSDLGRKALSLLTDPKDIAFLLGGVYKSPESLSHLKEVVNQCEDTLLAKWCAARLGLEYVKEFQAKYSSSEKVKALVHKGLDEEPLFEMAHTYLTLGSVLSDDFPIRAEVLTGLARTKYVRGDCEKAVMLLEELAEKYPESEDGRKASRWKEELLELQELQERESGQSKNPPLGQASSHSALPVVVAAVAVGIVLMSLFFIFKKKQISQGK